MNGTVTKYLVDDRNPGGSAQVIEERSGADSTLVSYVYGLDLVSQTRGNAQRYFGYDALGSVRFLTTPDGAIDDTFTYDAFGILIDATGTAPDDCSYRFTGEQWDQDLEIYYLRARYFNPQIGRFWTQDDGEQGSQEDPLSLHLYIYCADNPINLTDPSGHDFEALSVGSDLASFDGFRSVAGVTASKAVGGTTSTAQGHITVHIWNYRGSKSAWGHASMTLKDGTHISWWPSGVGRRRMPLLPMVYSAPANDPQTFADDVRLEEQPPDEQIVITCLDEAKIKAWWIDFKPTHLWKTLSQNCSTTVADGLKAGDAASANSVWGTVRLQWASHSIVWTPHKVESFCKAINKYHKP